MTAVIYTHAHLDSLGSVLGVVDADTDVPIIAPDHFLEHAVLENVYAGTAMLPPQLTTTPLWHMQRSLRQPRDRARCRWIEPGTVGLEFAATLTITATGQEEGDDLGAVSQ